MSIASAVRWVTRYKTTGQISPSPSGGDRRSGRIEAQRDYLLGLIGRTPDITLLEIQERLMQNCGERFSVSVLWGVPEWPRGRGAGFPSSSDEAIAEHDGELGLCLGPFARRHFPLLSDLARPGK